MPQVIVTEVLTQPVDLVWSTVLDVERYPERMESVRALKVLEQADQADGSQEAVVSWEVELEGAVLRWVQRERRDPLAYQVSFDQISGDLQLFRGVWRLRPAAEHITEATLEVEFEIGIPMLREVLEPFAIDAIARNSTQMLRALAQV